MTTENQQSASTSEIKTINGNKYKIGAREKIFIWLNDDWVLSSLPRKLFEKNQKETMKVSALQIDSALREKVKAQVRERFLSGARVNEIAAEIGTSHSTVSRYLRGCEKCMEKRSA
ncbi:MAG: hypothetical protein AAF434_17350 [Pseudomonadota bacterium]